MTKTLSQIVSEAELKFDPNVRQTALALIEGIIEEAESYDFPHPPSRLPEMRLSGDLSDLVSYLKAQREEIKKL